MTLSTTTTTLVAKPRVASIDIMRGIVMIIMALDHTRDFFHADVARFDPTDLTQSNICISFGRFRLHQPATEIDPGIINISADQGSMAYCPGIYGDSFRVGFQFIL